MRTTVRAAIASATATVATAGLLAVAAPAAQAAVETPAPFGEAIGIVAADAHTAIVTGRWQCSAGGQAHLWVSVKQGPDINGTDQTSSDYAKAWYDTNYINDGQGPTLTVPCDGDVHTAQFVVQRVKTTPWGQRVNSGPLKTGSAWVQFCIAWGPGDTDGTSYGAFHDVKR